MDGAVVDMVKNIVQVQKSQYDTFIQERLIDRSKLITDPIKTEQSAFAQNIVLPYISYIGMCRPKGYGF